MKGGHVFLAEEAELGRNACPVRIGLSSLSGQRLSADLGAVPVEANRVGNVTATAWGGGAAVLSLVGTKIPAGGYSHGTSPELPKLAL
jgi:hypothetical protein